MSVGFLDVLQRRILVFDGAMGTSVHARHLALSDFRGLENCTEILCETRPDVVGEIHGQFLEAGCDVVETNSFGSNALVLAEFGLEKEVRALNRKAAEIARAACRPFTTPDKPRFVAGSVGPGTRLVSLRQTTFDALADNYTEQIRGLMDGGIDVLLFETCQDILQAKAGIDAAERVFAECGRRVPIMVQVTVETTGTMLVGSDMAAALTALDAYPQVQVIGLNCATGPQEMSEHVRFLGRACDRYLSVQPNAGLPQLVDGRPHYPLTPEEMARWLREFVREDGVNIVGGCCGTTPAHMAAVVEAVEGLTPRPRAASMPASVSSLFQAVAIRQDNSILLVGERTNANGSKKFREMLAADDLDGMVELAKDQARHGSHLIDLCVAYVGRDERADMERLVARCATEVPVPLMIDSTEPEVIEAALKLAGGKCIVNSINLEDGGERCAQVLELCRRFGAAVVALTIDEEGMARTCERKVQIARRLYEIATERFGLRPGDILFDPLTFTICTGSEEDRALGLETLKAIRRIKREMPEAHVLLGVSNISFGVKPAVRHVLNSVFLHYASEAGLDAAIVHVAGVEPLYRIDEPLRELARRLIFNERWEGQDPLTELINACSDAMDDMTRKAVPAASAEERLRQRIIDGNRSGLEADLDEAMARFAPLEIINTILLPGMKVVGDLFGAGQMQLPFVLQSAETMKAAVAHLEPHMDRASDADKGAIVLATVRGDVHDIGKNLVDILLANNGYTVHNLGIKQPIETIIEKWQETGADAIGMSGLLVKSTVVMRDNLKILNERGLRPPVILGGAALTRRYVENDLAKLYEGSVYYARDVFDGMAIMERICGRSEAPASAARGATSEAVRPAGAAAAAQAGASPSAAPSLVMRSTVATDVPTPEPPFWGRRVIEQIPLRDVLTYLNETMLFQVQWQFKKQGRPSEEFDRYIDAEVRPIYRDLVARCECEQILRPRAVYGYWPCQSEGDTLCLYDPDDRRRVVARFDLPRQRKEPYWCLADFWRPASSGQHDVIALSAVTVGPRASEIARAWFAEDRYRDYLYLHGLSVEAAEALAEYIHKQVRVELGIADQDAREVRKLFQQGYRGSRFSFGYPACPSLEDQAKLWPLLRPGDIGVTLSEEFQLEPEQSTTALIAHHPEARYFRA